MQTITEGNMELRTHNCGELTEQNVGQKVKLCGWLSSTRDLGAVIFFVLRDFYGYTQVQRAYEMNSTAIQTTDEMMQTANSLKR